jgi:hypothetical protein
MVAFVAEPKVFLVGGSHRDVEICVLEIEAREPVPLLKTDVFQRELPETFLSDVPFVESFQVEDGS